MHFLVLRITADLDNLHSVQKGSGDRLQSIRRGHKQNLGKIQRHFQVMIPELHILFTVQHFQKSRESITFIIIAHLVDLIQQHQGILHFGSADRLRDPSRHRAHISLPVSPDLRLVPDTAKRDPDIRLLQGPGQGFGNGRLTGSRRSCQTEDRHISLPGQGADRQKLQHPLLHLLQAIMVLIQHLLRIGDILVVLAGLIPGKLQHGLDICPDHACLCRAVHGIAEPFDLFGDLLLHLRRRRKGVCRLLEFIRVGKGGLVSQFLPDQL